MKAGAVVGALLIVAAIAIAFLNLAQGGAFK